MRPADRVPTRTSQRNLGVSPLAATVRRHDLLCTAAVDIAMALATVVTLILVALLVVA
jgi:hypothetical protein